MFRSAGRIAVALAAVVCFVTPIQAQDKIKVILDTDIGGDIDDAWALGFLINCPKFEPLGVTIAHGFTTQRAKVALKLLHVTGRDDIPVAVGRQTDTAVRDQFAWAEDYVGTKPIDAPAARFLVDTVKKYPKQVTVMAVGPLENIGDAIRLSPDFKNNIKELVLMSGCIYGRSDNRPPIPEWNVRGSVKDSQTVYASGIVTRIVPLDATTHVLLKDDERFALRKHKSPLTGSLELLYRLWMVRPNSRMILHDQLAVAETAYPGKFFGKYETLPIAVDDQAWTRIDKENGKPITVCLEPKRDAFVKFYMDVLMGKVGAEPR